MRSTLFTITLAIAAATNASCVREEALVDCPGVILIAVRDKNYDNVAQAGDVAMAENLPLSDYVGSLVVRDHPSATEIYAAWEAILAADGFTYPVPEEHLARGTNEFSAVGRALDAALEYDAAQAPLILHPNKTEGEDIYLGSDAVKFPRLDDYTVWMLRTKGKLMVDVAGAPAATAQIRLSVGSVYSTVTDQGSELIYNGSTSVSRAYTSQGATGTYHLKLAPSADPASPLTITFLDANGATLHELGLDVAIERNRITRIKAEYAADRNLWTLTANVDGEWVNVENMELS